MISFVKPGSAEAVKTALTEAGAEALPYKIARKGTQLWVDGVEQVSTED
jgi:hypothetical protein